MGQALKGNSGPWTAGDQVLSIDSTKENIEYICVEMADDHPRNKQRETWGSGPQQAAIAANKTNADPFAANADTFAEKDAAIKTKDDDIAANTADIAAKDATIAAAPAALREAKE